VVVSKPTATFGGVVQYDMGNIRVRAILQRTGMLKPPPAVLMANVQRLQAQQIRSGSRIPEYLAAVLGEVLAGTSCEYAVVTFSGPWPCFGPLVKSWVLGSAMGRSAG
jgi:hypothetical protein